MPVVGLLLVEKAEGEVGGFAVDVDASDSLVNQEACRTC